MRYVEIMRYNGADQEVVVVPEKIGGCYVTNIRVFLLQQAQMHPEVKVLVLPSRIQCIDALDYDYNTISVLGMNQLEYIAINGETGDDLWICPGLLQITPWCQRKIQEAKAAGEDCLVLFDTLLVQCLKNTKTLVVPEGVISYVDGWCAEAPDLTDITFPSYEVLPWMDRSGIQHLVTLRLTADTTYIYGGAENMTSLEQVVGTTSRCRVGYVEERAFFGCTALRAFPAFDSDPYIGEEAFMNCTSLPEVQGLGVSMYRSEVGARAFKNCTALPELLIKQHGEVLLGEEAFCGCTSLKTLEMYDNVQAQARAFADCTSLATVSMAATEQLDPSIFEGSTNITDVLLYEGSDLSLLDSLFKDAAGPITVSCLATDAQDVKLPEKFTLVLRDK